MQSQESGVLPVTCSCDKVDQQKGDLPMTCSCGCDKVDQKRGDLPVTCSCDKVVVRKAMTYR